MVNLITEYMDIWAAAQTQKPNGGRGRGNHSSGQNLHGIKKLRELILELAVRGKLVPQDPDDEPASVLMVKIAKGKKRLVKEGKIKKQKPLPEINEDEKQYSLPENWEWIRLTAIYYSISPSGKKLKSSEIEESGEFPVIDQGKSYIAGYTGDASLLIEIPGPVIVFGDHTTERKYIDFNFVAGADGTKILRPYFMDERYFHTYLLSYKLESRGYARHFKVLNDNLMALPPLAEQHRIVAKVDELMAICDQLEQQQTDSNAIHQTLVETLLATLENATDQRELTKAWQRIANHFDTLITTEQSIDQLKQIILQLAVMGKLVPQDSKDEPASVLLEKIAKEKKRLIKEGKIKKQKPLPKISEDAKPFELPKGWELSMFSQISQEISTGPFGSMIHKRDYVKGGIPLINPSHMIDCSIVEENSVTVSLEKAEELISYKLAKGSIIMARRGELGRCALVTEREDGWLCGTGSFQLKFHCDICRAYILLLFRTESIRTYLGGKSVGTTMTNLNHGILKEMPVPVPPRLEQHRIVAKVDELMILCDTLKDRLNGAQITQVQLADAIVGTGSCMNSAI